MTIDNGSMLHIAETLTEKLDGVEMALPAGDYRALAVGSIDAGTASDEVDRYLLLPVGRERVHPISADGLEQLATHAGVEVTGTD